MKDTARKIATLLCITIGTLGGCASTQECSPMSIQDEVESVRAYYDAWMRGMDSGDLELIRSLIADDAVFFAPGTGAMDKDTVAAAVTASDPNYEAHLESDIKEIRVLGEHAWLMTEFSLWLVDTRTDDKVQLVGHTLSILERTDQGWKVVRDMNTTTPAPTE